MGPRSSIQGGEGRGLPTPSEPLLPLCFLSGRDTRRARLTVTQLL